MTESIPTTASAPRGPAHQPNPLFKDLFALPVPGAFLIVSPLRQFSCLLNRPALDQFISCLCSDTGETEPAPEVVRLAEQLHLAAAPRPAEPQTDLHPGFLGIIPTRACNLACAYCGFDAGRSGYGKMDFRTAAAAVDWMAEQVKSSGRDSLDIHFFGGEPFAASEVMDVVIHRARLLADTHGLTPYFEVSTNGFFDRNQARFAGDYFDTVVLSFDGAEPFHNRHRSRADGGGSFDRVAKTAERLSRSQTKLCFRCCISDANVRQMTETAQWFCTAFHPSVINFETLKPTRASGAAGLSPPDPYTFAANFIRAAREIEAAGIGAVYAAADISGVRHSFCPVGRDTLIVSPGGRISSCYLQQHEWEIKGLNLDVGRIGKDGCVRIDLEQIRLLRRLVKDKPLCENCFCRWTCAGGCHVAHTPPGGPVGFSDFCIQTRLITACRLLADLEAHGIAASLIGNRFAMEQLALQPSDRLSEWNPGYD